MVTRPARSTRDRLLAAALEEFAARGFDGAKVDRIARAAGANKAMLYYHFRSKAALFLAVLRAQFAAVAEAVGAARDRAATPDVQLRTFVEVLAREALVHRHFPALWLREVADGGRHVDASVVAEISRVLGTLAAILREGARARVFGRAHPLVVQMGIVAPLMFFAASGPLRARARRLLPPPVAAPDVRAVIRHVQEATLAVLTASAPARSRRQPRRLRP